MSHINLIVKREAPRVEAKPSGRGLQLGKTKKAAGLDKILQEEGGSSAVAESVSTSKQESFSTGPAEKVKLHEISHYVCPPMTGVRTSLGEDRLGGRERWSIREHGRHWRISRHCL